VAHQTKRKRSRIQSYDVPWKIIGLFKVYVVDLEGKNRKEVTSGKHGATHSPSFSNDGTKVTWTELAEDGYESDRAVIVVYDLKKSESYQLAPRWDRSPASLSVSLCW
jgi:Tol biopolymer transport system component